MIASSQTIEEIRKYVAADSLHYLSLEKMMTVFDDGQEGYCKACFDGRYPVALVDKIPQPSQLDLFVP